MRGPVRNLVVALAVLSIVGACQASPAPSTGATSPGAAPTLAPGNVTGSAPPTVESSPSPAISGAEVTAIAVRQTDVCELHADGTVACWDPDDPTPVPVPGIADATAITANVGYTCALRATGAVLCWGLNATGQLGDGTLTNTQTPVEVSGITDAIAIEAGQGHACAVLSAGGVMCWGNNGSGQLGNGSLSGVPTPIAAPAQGVDDATALAAGATHTCAIRSGGGVKCWGSGVQLGNGTDSPFGDATGAVSVPGIADAVAIAAGRYDTCVVLSVGAPPAAGESPFAPSPSPSPPPRNNVRCWGWDMSELDSTVFRHKPVAVPGITDATAVAAGLGHVCVIRTGTVACWGQNEFGALGDGNEIGSSTPVPVPGIRDAKSISTTSWLTCVLTSGGSVKCWGS